MYYLYCVFDGTLDMFTFSSPEIWFDDVDISEINGEVETPPHKKPRGEDTKPTNVELVSGKCAE